MVKFLKYTTFCVLILFLSSPVSAKKPKDMVLCTWNIGHFSNGAKSYSLIDVAKYNELLADYRSLVYDEIAPDVITINEYNIVFCGKDDDKNPHQTSSLLFNGFRKKTIGPKCWGICNAVFSNLKMKKLRPIYFVSQKSTEGDEIVKSRENYFIESELKLNGKKVSLACIHLLFSSKVGKIYQQKQIEELIDYFADKDRVIICGDWNIEVLTSLKDAGYKLANDGSLKTFPSKRMSLDNIAVKGLEISDVRMVKTKLSDHYPLVCRISLEE